MKVRQIDEANRSDKYKDEMDDRRTADRTDMQMDAEASKWNSGKPVAIKIVSDKLFAVNKKDSSEYDWITGHVGDTYNVVKGDRDWAYLVVDGPMKGKYVPSLNTKVIK